MFQFRTYSEIFERKNLEKKNELLGLLVTLKNSHPIIYLDFTEKRQKLKYIFLYRKMPRSTTNFGYDVCHRIFMYYK